MFWTFANPPPHSNSIFNLLYNYTLNIKWLFHTHGYPLWVSDMIFEQPLSIDENSMSISAWPTMPTYCYSFRSFFLEVSVYMDLTVSISNNIALLNRNYIQGLCSAQTYNLNEIPFLTRNISFRLTVCSLLNFKWERRPAQVSWVIHVSKKVATLQKTLTNWLSHGINIWLYPTS